MIDSRKVTLESVQFKMVLEKLNLDISGLEEAAEAASEGNRTKALSHLLEHYRETYADSRPTGGGDISTETADKIANHILQWGPYEEAQYGDDIDWDWDPRGDIEWVAAMFRFYWAAPLVEAFGSTLDEKYARTFVDLASDWISKYPLENHKASHPVYGWDGYAWLDIQTGIRATNICNAFRTFVHAKSFTPEFLEILLASCFDHQVKTELIPMGRVHNKAIFEQRGFINIAYTFQEFSDSRRWLELAYDRARKVLLGQTTSDGVQREWSYGYHEGVLRDAVEIKSRMGTVGVPVTEDYDDCIRKMYDYIYGIASPDLGAPMFGDASRPKDVGPDRSKWPLYKTLVQASELLGDPKYEARATLDKDGLPANASIAFKEAGIYAMRSGWGPEDIHLALHCSPPAISGHDQPDNGTFELYAYGRWLMTDTGFYTYGHDLQGRAWHRQTSVHQTLTLDGRDSQDDGRYLLWKSDSESDVLVVENGSYEGLTHRRTVWFVDRHFFVFLDEAIGDVQGALDLHFQFAPGDVKYDSNEKKAWTVFDDANVLVVGTPVDELELEEEVGWFAWGYGHRTPRSACRFRHSSQSPAFFLTGVVPYRGKGVPELELEASEVEQGAERACVTAKLDGVAWELGRDLAGGEG